jgi:gas vesicle structural protein
MTTATGPSSSSLADVIDTILDKGLVIDAYVRVSLVGIEIISIDARVVVASVDTYLRFAEAVNRLSISESDPKAGLPEIVEDSVGAGMQRQGRKAGNKAVESAAQKVSDFLGGAQPERQKAPRRQKST